MIRFCFRHTNTPFLAFELSLFPMYLLDCIFNATKRFKLRKEEKKNRLYIYNALPYTFRHFKIKSKNLSHHSIDSCKIPSMWKIQLRKRKCEKPTFAVTIFNQDTWKVERKKVIKSSNEWQINVYNCSLYRCNDISSNQLAFEIVCFYQNFRKKNWCKRVITITFRWILSMV